MEEASRASAPDFGEVALETERLVLRRITGADHEALYEFHRNPNVQRFLGTLLPRDEHMATVPPRWEAHYREHGFGLWAAVRKEDGRVIGRVGPIVQEVEGERQVEVGYMLGEEFWGRGYAIEAARASRDWAFRNLDAPHVISLINPLNAPSIRVAERNGMTFWKMARWREMDIGVHRITRAEWERLMEDGDGG
jgi:ribosomal-protein-alanine N-acetyltransferase